MIRRYEGKLLADGLRFAIVVSRFNEIISMRLLDGAIDALKRHGAAEEGIEVAYVPGAFELPLTARLMAEKGGYDAVICLGAVIRGSTPHFEYVAAEAAKGIAQATVAVGLPITFGVITADSLEQAIERAGAKSGNKGWDAALTALEMANLLREIGS